MSRVAKAAIDLPQGVTATVASDKVTVKGAKGSLTLDLKPGISISRGGYFHRQNPGTLLLSLTDPPAANVVAAKSDLAAARYEFGADGMLASLLGSYLPFAKTRAERTRSGDPRESIAERYGGFEAYRKRFADTCNDLMSRRYLLREDAERLTANRAKVRSLFTASTNSTGR